MIVILLLCWRPLEEASLISLLVLLFVVFCLWILKKNKEHQGHHQGEHQVINQVNTKWLAKSTPSEVPSKWIFFRFCSCFCCRFQSWHQGSVQALHKITNIFQLTPVASCASNQGISKEMLLTIIVKLLRQPPTILPKFQWLPFKQRMSNLDDAGQTVIITISFTIAWRTTSTCPVELQVGSSGLPTHTPRSGKGWL